MPYLPAKDELVSLNRLSSRGLWKWYNSKVLDRRLYGVGQHFTFCQFSRKRKFFGNFDFDFRKCFTKGIFLTKYEEFRNFRFDGKILDIYGQPLLSFLKLIRAWRLRIFTDTLILVLVNENCCLCICITELYFLYWFLVVSLVILIAMPFVFSRSVNIASRSTQNTVRIKRFWRLHIEKTIK